MKTTFLPLLLLCSILIYSCKKNNDETPAVATVPTVTVDFANRITAGVNGFITDESGHAVTAAVVEANGITASTNEYGYFTIRNASFAKTIGFIKVTKAGYFTGYRSFSPIENSTHFVRLQLLPKTTAGSVDAGAGGQVTVPGTANIIIPANGVVVENNGATYTGAVNISAQWLDPSAMQTNLTMPGDLSGINDENQLAALTTYGMMAVELTGNSGELLQLATGKKAQLDFPIPVSMQANAPASIPLWYFDETKGVWKQEGTAVKTGNVYKAEVCHFSYWNCDIPTTSLVSFSARLTDNDLNPLVNVAVWICDSNDPINARMSFTDNEGRVSGWIPANSDLLLQSNLSCSSLFNIQHIITGTAPVVLNPLKVIASAQNATIRGTVVDCNGALVNDGYILMEESNNVYTVIPVQNGAFNTTRLVCGTVNAVVIPFSNAQTLPGARVNITIAPGVNDLGAISTCVTTYEHLSYTLDGVSETFSIPVYDFNSAYDGSAGFTEFAVYYMPVPATVFRMDLLGVPAVGQYYAASNYFALYYQYEFLTPTLINITQYGNVGEYVNGNFSGTVKKISDNSIHTVSVTFSFIRMN